MESLSQVHAHSDRLHTTAMVATALKVQSTAEQERQGTWLTQCEIAEIGQLACHEDDKMPSVAGGNQSYSHRLIAQAHAEASGAQLQYADINEGPAKWTALHGPIPYCFLTSGPHAVDQDAAESMRFAFIQVGAAPRPSTLALLVPLRPHATPSSATALCTVHTPLQECTFFFSHDTSPCSLLSSRLPLLPPCATACADRPRDQRARPRGGRLGSGPLGPQWRPCAARPPRCYTRAL